MQPPLALLRLALGAAVLFTTVAPANGATLDTIRIGDPRAEAGATIYYAQELGFFEKAGLRVELQPVVNGPAAATAVASNAVDVASAVVTSLAVAHNKGIPLVAVAAGALYDSHEPYAGIVVPATSTIQTARDLDGKIVAVPGLGTIMEYGVRAWMTSNGGDPSTVKFIETPLATMAPALDSGRVDAVAVTEPFFTLTKTHGRVLGYHYNAVAPRFLTTAWLANTQWASTHADLVRRFRSAMAESARWANRPANHAQREEILEKSLGLLPGSMRNVISTPYGTELTPALIQPQIDLAAKYGNFAPFPARDIVFSP